MSKANEQAYPRAPFTQPSGEFDWGDMGLTKLELFSAMALQGMCAHEGQLNPAAGRAVCSRIRPRLNS